MVVNRQILEHVDVLIAGRYAASLHLGHGLLACADRRIHRLTKRHRAGDLADILVPVTRCRSFIQLSVSGASADWDRRFHLRVPNSPARTYLVLPSPKRALSPSLCRLMT